MLHTNQDAILIYNRNSALKHMVSRIRRDPNCFSRYQHNRDLVALVNCFALLSNELPSGWETKLDQTGKVDIMIYPKLYLISLIIVYNFSAILYWSHESEDVVHRPSFANRVSSVQASTGIYCEFINRILTNFWNILIWNSTILVSNNNFWTRCSDSSAKASSPAKVEYWVAWVSS